MDKLRVFEAFSGYGSQSIALRNLGIDYEVVAISEIDKYAIQAYEAIHGEVNNLGDITKIKVENIPKHDLFTYSFPCQDISVAGNMKGIEKGETRSGLLYECEKIIEHCKPKYLLLENVKNLVGKKFKHQFDEWLRFLESLGYTNYWKILNAKDYGVPQNRERVFVVSILDEHESYKFPEPTVLNKCIKDVLEDCVDEKYYISNEVIKKFIPNKNFSTGAIRGRYNNKGEIEQRLELRNDNITNTITTVQKDNVILENKILDVGFIKKSQNGKKHQSNTVIDENYLMRTLTACDYKSPQLIITNSNKSEIKSDSNFRIRKLTPKECFRLMGMNDEDINKIQDAGVSATQQYKMAGNSIVINVLESIFKNLFIGIQLIK